MHNLRRDMLREFEQALWSALDKAPGGYPGADQDRERFCAPIERVIGELRTELAKLTEE